MNELVMVWWWYPCCVVNRAIWSMRSIVIAMHSTQNNLHEYYNAPRAILFFALTVHILTHTHTRFACKFYTHFRFLLSNRSFFFFFFVHISNWPGWVETSIDSYTHTAGENISMWWCDRFVGSKCIVRPYLDWHFYTIGLTLITIQSSWIFYLPTHTHRHQ